MEAAWDAPLVGEDYHDEVDYDLESPSLFEYDYLEKLGECGTFYNITVHGNFYLGHKLSYPYSKEWLGYLGQCGDNWFIDILGIWAYPTPSPYVPSKGGIDHEWKEFTVSFSGFGNENGMGKTITWIDP